MFNYNKGDLFFTYIDIFDSREIFKEWTHTARLKLIGVYS